MEWWTSLDSSEQIQLIGVLVALTIGIASVIISIFTLRHSSKMIRESTRPNLSMYFEQINCGAPINIFVLKNLGQSSAHIIDFQYPTGFNEYGFANNDLLQKTLDSIKGMSIAPQQKVLFYTNNELPYERLFEFWITYKGSGRKYTDKFSVNADSARHAGSYRSTNTRGNVPDPISNISYAFQEFIERNL